MKFNKYQNSYTTMATRPQRKTRYDHIFWSFVAGATTATILILCFL